MLWIRSVNEAANWRYMSGGRVSSPVVFWGIVNRGGEQAAQHSQALHALYAHIPGLKVVMPSRPRDAKGLMIAAIRDPDPVVFIDDRWLYDIEETVPEEMYEIPIGQAAIRCEGVALTIAAVSYLVVEAEKAAAELADDGIEVEVVDLRTAKPLDEVTLLDSVKKTGRFLVVDSGWMTGGLSAEVVARVSEKAFEMLKTPVRRLALPDCPAPASRTLEEAYYPKKEDIVDVVKTMLE